MTDYSLFFPRPFAAGIDDLGWRNGSNLSANNPPGPLRTGVKRTHDLIDYKNIIDVAKEIGVRIQCLFVLGDFDRENTLSKYPTTTPWRERWDNSKWVNDEQFEIMEYICNEAGYMEFGIHGIYHEYWADDGIQRRAEWYNLIDRNPWPEEILQGHIQAFREIMAQYSLSLKNGHSFPESFVPCAYGYFWNPGGDYSLGKLLAEAGVKYASTDFGQIPELFPPQEVNGGGFDHGIHVINRMNYGNTWYELASLPKVLIEMQGTDIIESHWANWLASDDILQHNVKVQWTNYYRAVQQLSNRYIAKNTEQLHSQWLYNKYTLISETDEGSWVIDNTQMPDDAYLLDKLGNMVLKVKLRPEEHIAAASIDSDLIPGYFEEDGYAFIYLPKLEKKKYTFRYKKGLVFMPVYIFNDGTYNVYSLHMTGKVIQLTLRMYGSQWVKIRCPKPDKVISLTHGLVIDDSTYDEEKGFFQIKITASNIQGIKGKVKVNLL
jgi:hypothetical protein